MILQQRAEPTDVHLSPETILGRCSELLLELMQAQEATADQILRNLFAIGVNRITAKLSGVNVTGTNLLTYSLAGALAGFGGFLVVGNTGVVHLQLGQPFLFPSIAAVAVGGTLLSGGKGSYWGTMAGAIVLTLITSLLTTMQMPDSVRRMVLGATLLILISIYGRQRALRQ